MPKHGAINIALRPRKPEGSLGRTAQDGHLDSHTAPELCVKTVFLKKVMYPTVTEFCKTVFRLNWKNIMHAAITEFSDTIFLLNWKKGLCTVL